MGRIADALKRAEQERQTERSARSPGGSTAVLDGPPPSSEARPVAEGRSRAIRSSTGSSPAVVQGLSEVLVPYYERSSLITEQYRSLRTRLLSQNPQFEHRIIGITSYILSMIFS